MAPSEDLAALPPRGLERLGPDYGRQGRLVPSSTREIKRDHPTWGAGLIAREFIKIEVSLREENRLPTEIRPARTLLRDRHSGRPTLGPVEVRALHVQEAYAEKIRAALTRREPAIRDFFDLDHAARLALFDHRDPAVIGLVAAKLLIAGNRPADFSEARVATLRNQVEVHLRPVLRTVDYEVFNLQRALSMLEEIVRQLDNPPT